MKIAAACALLAITLTSTVGCASKDWIDRTLVTENVTGSWTGMVGGRSNFRLDLKHEGPKLTGTCQRLGSGAPEALEGSVAGDVFTLRSAHGELTVSGDEMTGQIAGWTLGGAQPRQISMRRDGASPPSSSPPR